MLGKGIEQKYVKQTVKRMMEMWLRGVRREWDYPVLMSGEDLAVTDEKAEMMAEVFVQVHSSANLSEERQTGG
jgi:Cu/Ag efflux pump CusA